MMYDYEQVEYAIFHWVFGGEYGLPGINPNSLLNPAFFEKYPTKSNYKSFSDLFSTIKSNPDLNELNIRFSKPLEIGDYFLYSLINLIKHNIRNMK